MSDKPYVLSVDDEVFIQDIIKEALEPNCEVAGAGTGREALALLGTRTPDLIILDVEMPELDGYDTCRAIKENFDYADVPVLFLSARDRIEDRLAGLDAGGDDYLTKPFHLELLLSRVKALLALTEQRKALRESLRYATSTAMTAMSGMGELGRLLEALKQFNACTSFDELAAAIMAALASFDLQGMVQIRDAADGLNLTSRGPASPLDVSILAQMASMERIVHFKSRMAINYPQVTLLVTTMPDDDELAGRLRDHLAMLAEAADVRVQSLAQAITSARRGAAITAMIERITQTLHTIDEAQRGSRVATTLAINAAIDASEKALLSAALTDSQEDYLAQTIREGLERVADVQAGSIDIQNHLSGLIDELKSVS